MKKWLAAVVMAAALAAVLVACGEAASTDANQARLGAFEDILVGGPTIEALTSTSVSLLAITSVDIICAWAYGPTTGYGEVATHAMDAMGMMAAGRAHSDHNPVLTGLQPNTLYHYQFVGTGPDGTVYRSGDFTFQTPAS